MLRLSVFVLAIAASQAFSVYHPLDCINDVDPCQSSSLSCPPAVSINCPSPPINRPPLQPPTLACVPVLNAPNNPLPVGNNNNNGNAPCIIALLNALKSIGVVPPPGNAGLAGLMGALLGGGGGGANAPANIPPSLGQSLISLGILGPRTTRGSLLDLGILSPTVAPGAPAAPGAPGAPAPGPISPLLVANILNLIKLAIGGSSPPPTNGTAPFPASIAPLIDVELLTGLLTPALNNMLAPAPANPAPVTPGLPGIPGTTPGLPGLGNTDINTIILQLLAALANPTTGNPSFPGVPAPVGPCPAGTVPVLLPSQGQLPSQCFGAY